MCVDHILKELGCANIEACVGQYGVSFEELSEFCLVDSEGKPDTIYKGPRVGLSLKSKSPDKVVMGFWAADLRYVTNPKVISKHKQYLVIQMLHDGKSIDEVCKELGVKKAVVTNYQGFLKEGEKMNMKEFFKVDLAVGDICKAFACAKSLK